MQVKFKLVDLALIMNDEHDVDDAITFSRVTKENNNF